MAYSYRYVYFAHRREVPSVQRAKWVKIGYTQNIKKRMAILGCKLIFAVRCDWDFAPVLERGIHDEFRRVRRDRTEWFEVDSRLLELIDGVLKIGHWPWDRTQDVIRG